MAAQGRRHRSAITPPGGWSEFVTTSRTSLSAIEIGVRIGVNYGAKAVFSIHASESVAPHPERFYVLLLHVSQMQPEGSRPILRTAQETSESWAGAVKNSIEDGVQVILREPWTC